MATTTINITVTTPAGLTIQTVLDTLTDYWGYQATIDGSPNPQSKGQFVQAKIGDFLKQSYIAARASKDAEAARTAAVTTASQVTVD